MWLDIQHQDWEPLQHHARNLVRRPLQQRMSRLHSPEKDNLDTGKTFWKLVNT